MINKRSGIDLGTANGLVYVRGEGQRTRLPDSEPADLYTLRAEAEWLNERAAR